MSVCKPSGNKLLGFFYNWLLSSSSQLTNLGRGSTQDGDLEVEVYPLPSRFSLVASVSKNHTHQFTWGITCDVSGGSHRAFAQDSRLQKLTSQQMPKKWQSAKQFCCHWGQLLLYTHSPFSYLCLFWLATHALLSKKVLRQTLTCLFLLCNLCVQIVPQGVFYKRPFLTLY